MPTGTMEPSPLDPNVVSVIQQYVANKYGWRSSAYRIEADPPSSEGYLVYSIIHRDDERRAVPGSGKSIQVYYDHVKNRIVREFRLV